MNHLGNDDGRDACVEPNRHDVDVVRKKFVMGAVAGVSIAGVSAAATRATRKLLDRGSALPTDPDRYSREATGLAPGQLRARFLGVSTILFTDGQTSILCDGFFSRPGRIAIVAGKISPDREVIEDCLAKAGITSLAAVTTAHSHYDHAMDSAVVAQLTGAQLVGSDSTLNIGRGVGLPDSQLTKVIAHHPYRFGQFTVTFVESDHSPKGKFPGLIKEPLAAPAKVSEYKMAQCYSMILEHAPEVGPTRKVLVHASAGYRPGMLTGYQADVAFLGTTLVTKQPQKFQDEYWEHTVGAVGARRIYPIHWDDFTKPLSEPLVPFPKIIDDFSESLRYLDTKCAADAMSYQIPRSWIEFDPFAGV